MTRIALFVCLAITTVAFALSAFGLAHRFDANRQARHDICVQVEKVKAILHDEHSLKLRRAEEFLREHPHGAGVLGRKLILNSIADEKVVVSKTTPRHCTG